MSIDAFPGPEQLGAGWRYRVDPGDAEGGYAGNGTPGLERDPEEVAGLAVPLGCPRGQEMPVAGYAFEVDYSFRDRPVVAIRMAFAGSRQARRFTDARAANLRACAGLSGGPAIGPLVLRVTAVGKDALLSDRTPASEPWTEAAIRRGSDVLLLAAEGRYGEQPLRPHDVRAIRTALAGVQ